MKKIVTLLALFAAGIVCLSVSLKAAETILVVGTYQKGNNVTEPRPKSSEYLETLHGGIVVVGNGAGFYLFAKVIRIPTKSLYVVVEYENPEGKPLTNEMNFAPSAKELHFSAPEFVRGLKNYSDYEITVRIFESKESKEPIDVLKQTVRSYVDTRGPKVQLFSKIKPKS